MSVKTGVVITGEKSFRIEPEWLVKCKRCGQTATSLKRYILCPHCDEMYRFDEVLKKEYPEILDKLEQFALEKYQTRIFIFEKTWHKVSFNGFLCDVEANVIFGESNSPHARRATGIAHEIGHVIDFHENYNKNLTRWNQTDRLKLEKTAWKYAEELLKSLGFDDWEYFEQHKTAGLKSYQEEKSEIQ